MDKKIELYTRKQIKDALRLIFKNKNEKAYFKDIRLNPKFVSWTIDVYPFSGSKRQTEITFFDKPVDPNTHQKVTILDLIAKTTHACNAEVIIHASTFKELPPDSKGTS